jgi:hypothetical protein
MLWAQQQVHLNKDQEIVIVILGALLGGVISGAIPFSVGVIMKQPTLGVICGILSAGTGALFGCCLGLPAALLLSGVIAVVGMALRNHGPAYAPPVAEDEDIARGFQIPGSKDEPPPPSRFSDKERDRRHQEKYGFRPRQRRADPEGGSSSGSGSSYH